jgi:hypothetical protein
MSATTPPPDKPVDHLLLSGKRRAPRQRHTVPVKCIGPSGKWYTGRTVDVSRGGMLLEITDEDFLPIGASADLLPFAARVAMQFPRGLDANFGDGAVQVHANVVRLVAKAGGPGPVLLGCKFDPALTDFDCGLLGIEPGTDETSEPKPGRDTSSGPLPVPAAKKEAVLPPKRVPDALPAADEVDGEVVGAGAAAGDTTSARLLRGRDELRMLIGAEEARWKEEAGDGPAPKARIVTFTRTGPVAEPEAEGASVRPAAQRVRPLPKPVGSGPGRMDETDVAASKPVEPASRQPATSTWASTDSVVVYAFPQGAPLFGPRYLGLVVDVKARTATVDLPLPPHEKEALDFMAGLGSYVRLVCLRDGRVLWETSARVAHLQPGRRTGWGRAVFHAVKAPPTSSRRFLSAAPAA